MFYRKLSQAAAVLVAAWGIVIMLIHTLVSLYISNHASAHISATNAIINLLISMYNRTVS